MTIVRPLPDIVGFGDAGVYVSLSTDGATFAAPQFWLAQFGYNQGWHMDKHPRVLPDVDGDGRADIIGFAAGGLRATDLKTHIVAPPPARKAVIIGDVGTISRAPASDKSP